MSREYGESSFAMLAMPARIVVVRCESAAADYVDTKLGQIRSGLNMGEIVIARGGSD